MRLALLCWQTHSAYCLRGGTAGAGGEAVSAAGRMFEPARPTKVAAGEFGGKRMGLPPAPERPACGQAKKQKTH